MQRRKFLKETTIASLGFIALSRCSQNLDSNVKAVKKLSLSSDPKAYLDLPEGFSYKIISKQGNKMSDGFLVPGRPDGMGAFALDDNRVIIVRNHENSPNPIENSPFGPGVDSSAGSMLRTLSNIGPIPPKLCTQPLAIIQVTMSNNRPCKASLYIIALSPPISL